MSGYLLDTDVVVKATFFPERLSPMALRLFSDPAQDRWVSVVSAFELLVKIGIGKLPMPRQLEGDFEDGFQQLVDRFAARTLDVRLAHTARIRDLPLHHRDPFDRLLIGQALAENLTIVSGDRMFSQYAGLKVLSA